MSNELRSASSKLDELVSHKEMQELQLMKLKCDIREQKHIVNRLKKERVNEVVAREDDERVDVLPEKSVKVQKNKIKKVGAIKN